VTPALPIRPTPASVHAEGWRRRVDATAALLPSDAIDVRTGETLLVVVAHPDDETIALGATLADLSASGVAVHVVSLTSGEAALDHIGESVPGLAERRRRELQQAADTLGLAGCTALDLPDGRLGELPDACADAVREAVLRHRPSRVATLWDQDPHPDHQAVSRAVSQVCDATTVDEFLLWALHWTDPDTVAAAVHPVATDRSARRARARALEQYRSQVEPLSPRLEPVLPASVVAWSTECVVRR
jgi:LmbE family N-acetylglucosaminyl deacetylase